MARYDKNCAVCGKVYQYCTNCDQFRDYPAYMAMFCSQECVDILDTLSGFESGRISKEDAKKVAEKYPYAKKLKKSLATSYAKVMAEEKAEEPKEKPSVKEQTNIDIANNTVKKAVYDSTREPEKIIPRSIAYKKRH